MNSIVIGMIALIVVLLIGPFAALRAAAYYRGRRAPPKPQQPARPYDDEED